MNGDQVPARVVKPTIELMNRYWARLSEGGISRSDRILIGFEKKKDSLAMRFEDWDVRTFLQRYVHQMGANERYCHELVDASKPCRLYMDLDSKLGQGGGLLGLDETCPSDSSFTLGRIGALVAEWRNPRIDKRSVHDVGMVMSPSGQAVFAHILSQHLV